MLIVSCCLDHKAQIRGLARMLHSGAPTCSSVECVDYRDPGDLGRADIIVTPPYGPAIDYMREHSNDVRGAVVITDLFGPVGIDATLMLAEHLKQRLVYATTLLCDPQAVGGIAALFRSQVRIVPLPLFTHPDFLPRVAAQRVPHVVYVGSTFGYRQQAIDLLLSTRVPLVVAERLSPSDYASLLGQALIGLDISGTGLLTYRLHELFMSGALPLSQYRSYFFLGSPPRDGHEIVYFRSMDELRIRVRFWLAHPEAAEALARAAQVWHAATQSSELYVRYLIDVAVSGATLSPAALTKPPCPWSWEP